MKIIIKFFLFVILLSKTINAGTISPSTPDDKHVSYAKSGFNCVVKIVGTCECDKAKEKKHSFSASAVAIKPKWFLTAGHVVKEASDVQIKISDKTINALKIIVNPNFEKDKFGFNDIALGYLAEDMGLDFYPEIYRSSDEINKIVSICGYGMTGTFSTGAVRSDGLKRAGSNKISRCERSILVCDLFDKATELEFIIAMGDSGGGLFIGNKLAGINTFVMAEDGNPNSDYGDEAAHTRISLYQDWIDATIKENE